MQKLSWALLIFGRAHTVCSGIPLAHVGASLRLAVGFVPRVVKDLRMQIDPNDRIRRAVTLCVGFG